MSKSIYTKPEIINLRTHPEFNEKWVQEIIAEDPTIIGLGELFLKDKERNQLHAGRLDLLLQEEENPKRYEVEIQLGKTDESHLIRTIEYWDLERKRYPQYEHCAVIIAEDITSRFLNVISLFNGFIPLIAIQMQAIKIGDHISLIFTKVLDQMTLGLVDDDEEVNELTDRDYWLKRIGRDSLSIVDELLTLINTIDSEYEIKYNKHVIAYTKKNTIGNICKVRPSKKFLRLIIKIAKNDEVDNMAEERGLNDFAYSKFGTYRFRIGKGEVEKYQDFWLKILKMSHENF